MYIEQAFKGDNAAPKVILTTILCGGVFFLNVLAVIFLPSEFFEQAYAMQPKEPSIGMLLLTLLPFTALLILLLILVRFLHNRSVLSLATSRRRFDVGRFLFAFGLIIIVTLVTFWFDYKNDPTNIAYVFNPSRFYVFFLICFVLLLFQIAFEEFFFRGFLTQQLGVASGNKWVPLVSTSVLFGLCHAANPEIFEMGFGLLAYYIGTGFLLGVIVQMDEGLELTLGYHFANNLIASSLVSFEHSALQSETVFKYLSNPEPSEMLRTMLIGMAVSYPLLLLVFAKVYRWTDWKNKLFGTVSNPFNSQSML